MIPSPSISQKLAPFRLAHISQMASWVVSFPAGMKDNNLEITVESGKNIISSNLLEEMLSDRDRSIDEYPAVSP